MREIDTRTAFSGGDRRAELVAAAKALQTWLYDRRSEWADHAPGTFDARSRVGAAGLHAAVPLSIPVPTAPEHEPEMAIIRELAVEASAAITPGGKRSAGLQEAGTAVMSALRAVSTRVLSLREPLARSMAVSGRGLVTAGGGLSRGLVASGRRLGGALVSSGGIAARGISAGASRLRALGTPLAEGAGRLGGAASTAGPAVAERLSGLREPLVRWSWRAAITAALVAAVAGVGWPALRYWQTLESAPAEEATPAPAPAASAGPARGRGTAPGAAGRLRVTSDPPGARVLVDGRDRGATPLDLDDLRTGTHAVVLQSASGTIRRSVSIKAGATTELAESIFAGFVHVSSPIELQVSAGGRGLRLDDRNQVLLPPGSHELRFENRAMGFVGVRKVDVEPGKATSISVVPPPSTLSVTSTAPGIVLVDGAPIGTTPLVDYGINLGTHEVTVRSEDGAERRFTVTVTTKPVQLAAEF